MRHTVEKHTKPCGCRSVGECFCNINSETNALDALVDDFAKEMKKKLAEKYRRDGYTGWDDPKWTPEQVKAALIAHIEKGDPVDLANFAAFWWNKI